MKQHHHHYKPSAKESVKSILSYIRPSDHKEKAPPGNEKAHVLDKNRNNPNTGSSVSS